LVLEIRTNVDTRTTEHDVEKQEPTGSSKEELQEEEEKKMGLHIVGGRHGKDGRRAGTFHNPHV
jgi:hypothetical protein